MANDWVSIAESGGVGDQLAKALWDLSVRASLNPKPTMRQFVDIRPTNMMARSRTETIDKWNYFDNTAIAAQKAALTEESDVDSLTAPAPTPITLTATEHGVVVGRTEKLANRTFAPVDPYLAELIGDSMVKVVDELLQDQILSDVTPTIVGGGANVNALTASNKLTGDQLRNAKARFVSKGVMPRDGQFYAAAVHPFVVLDLRTQTGSNGWRVPSEYGRDQSNIWKGEIGEFEGFRFTENARVRHATNTNGTPAEVFYSYLLGYGALAETVKVEPQVRISPVTDALGRFHKIGWYGDFGFKVFEDKAINVVASSASLEGDYHA